MDRRIPGRTTKDALTCRLVLRMPVELKSDLQKLAQQEKRSMNAQMVKVLEDALRKARIS